VLIFAFFQEGKMYIFGGVKEQGMDAENTIVSESGTEPQTSRKPKYPILISMY
jgi:hypothetical protein